MFIQFLNANINNFKEIYSYNHIFYYWKKWKWNIIFFVQILLPKPLICPNDVFERMVKCWTRDQNIRPTFREIYMFLKKKHMGDTLSSQSKKIDM